MCLIVAIGTFRLILDAFMYLSTLIKQEKQLFKVAYVERLHTKIEHLLRLAICQAHLLFRLEYLGKEPTNARSYSSQEHSCLY